MPGPDVAPHGVVTVLGRRSFEFGQAVGRQTTTVPTATVREFDPSEFATVRLPIELCGSRHLARKAIRVASGDQLSDHPSAFCLGVPGSSTAMIYLSRGLAQGSCTPISCSYDMRFPSGAHWNVATSPVGRMCAPDPAAFAIPITSRTPDT